MPTRLWFAALLATGCAWQPAQGQMSAAPIPSVLPNLNSMSPENAAGVLQYCVSKQLVSISVADILIENLTKNPEVVKSPGFSVGRTGQILTQSGKSFGIGQAPGYLQSRACDMVLTRAKHFM